jgi:2-C-methyl-D-erythritol 2,4-cyclodiphosphate synthase
MILVFEITNNNHFSRIPLIVHFRRFIYNFFPPDSQIPYLLPLVSLWNLPCSAYLAFMSYRIGFGTDFHQLAEGRDLWLGGVLVPHTKGAVGHSDADVLLHALCDALLGALGLGDIGKHFPDTDASLKNIDSKILLRRTYGLISEQGYALVNADMTLCLEKPKIMPHVPAMQACIAEILQVTVNDISIKATTTEKLGFVGREEGVMAHAVALLCKR